MPPASHPLKEQFTVSDKGFGAKSQARPDDRHPLLLPTGEPVGEVGFLVGQAEPAQ